MLHKTRGIVLSSIAYSEASLIVKVYTEVFGLQSYIVNSVRKPKPRYSMALFQPMNVLDMVVYHSPKVTLQRFSELRCLQMPILASTDAVRNALLIFGAELLNKTLKEEHSDEDLFSLLTEVTASLEVPETITKLWHLRLMLKLLPFLGFAIDSDIVADEHLNFSNKEIETMDYIANTDFESDVDLSVAERNSLLDKLLHYFSTHLVEFGRMKSPEILHSVLR